MNCTHCSNQPDWKPEDKTQLATRIQNLLTPAPAAIRPMPYDVDDEDIDTATESQLFAILDEELGS